MTKETITLPTDFFEHLLNCLDNQKYVHDGDTTGAQEAIDDTRKQARDFFHNGTPIDWPRKETVVK